MGEYPGKIPWKRVVIVYIFFYLIHDDDAISVSTNIMQPLQKQLLLYHDVTGNDHAYSDSPEIYDIAEHG